MASKTPSIDPEFAALCKHLTEEEYAFLENSIVSEGCRESIIAWDQSPYPILDGHTRHEICLANEKDFGVVYLGFTDRDAARNWAIRNQLGRRNASEADKSYLRGKLVMKAPHGGDRKTTLSERSSDTMSLDRTQKSVADVAAETGVTTKTIHRDIEFAKSVDAVAAKSPDIADKLRGGDIPKNAAAALAETPKRDLKKLEKLEGKELKEAVKEATKPDEPTPKPKAPAAAPKPSESSDANSRMKNCNAAIESLAKEITAIGERAATLANPHIMKQRHAILTSQLAAAAATLRAAKGKATCDGCTDKTMAACTRCHGTGFMDGATTQMYS